MSRRIKITSKAEANIIIKGVESLAKRGQKLTEKEEADYIFARMFLSEIRKRKKKEESETDTAKER